jgi:TRAP-type C4-dicarboxylate transport system substrate-binding protein
MLWPISSVYSEPTVIKTALITPEGSAWTRMLHEMAKEISEKTGGAVSFKIYAGGVSGDELDVIRKMKVNRIHAAGFSGVGMGVLLPEFRILEAPMLYNDYSEVDLIKEKYRKTLSFDLEKQGYVLLGFAEAGFVYLFSKNDISSPEWLKTAKMWAWKGDPVAENFFKANGIKTYPLHLTDVNTGLETGMIDSFYSPPLGAVAFQWHSKIRYMLDYPMVNSSGALILKKDIYEKISPENREILKTTAKKYCDQLIQATRKDNQEAVKIMEETGVRIVRPSKDQIQGFKKNAKASYESSIPALYSREVLNDIQQTLEKCRTQSAKP